MSNSFDNRERSAAMAEKRTQRLDDLRLYTLTDLEAILGVTHRTLLTYVSDGRLKAVKIAGKWRVSEETVRRFINGE